MEDARLCSTRIIYERHDEAVNYDFDVLINIVDCGLQNEPIMKFAVHVTRAKDMIT